jgi:hypothetical protein
LSGDEERMLFALRELWLDKSEVSLSDAYGSFPGQSASTSHRQVSRLVEKGLLELSDHASDGRRKLITFSGQAESLFKALG